MASEGLQEGAIAKRIFDPYFGIPLNLPGNHARVSGQRWREVLEPKIHQKPSPDYFEGLASISLPE